MVRTRSQPPPAQKRWSNEGAQRVTMDVLHEELIQKARYFIMTKMTIIIKNKLLF